MLRPQWPRPRAEAWLAIAVVAWFLLFQLTFLGWTGGSATGPRYLTPALPFVFFAARRGFERFRRVAAVFIAISIAQMLVVTAVEPLLPANEQGPPQHYDPVGSALANFGTGNVAMREGATNVGLMLGLPARWSVVPAVAVVGLFFVVAAGAGRRRRRGSQMIAN
jgi:hypothetical protein